MKRTKTLEISSKKEEQFEKEKLLWIKSSLISCLASIKELWKDWIKSIWWFAKVFAGKISDAFAQVSWEDVSLTEEFVQDHLSHYWF